MTERTPQAHRWFSAALARQTMQLEASWLRAALYRPATAPALALSVLAPDRSGAIWLRLVERERFAGALRSDSSELPFTDAAFSVVVLHHAHEFCAAPLSLLADCSRLLIPGGRLLISGFNPFAWSRLRWRREFTDKADLRSVAWMRSQLRQLDMSCARTRYLPWSDSYMENHLPLAQLHAIYLLEASKRPPDFLPLRQLQLPAGALPG